MSQSTFLKYGYFVVSLTINFLSLSVHAQAHTYLSYEVPAGMLELHAFIVTVQHNQSKNKPQARSTWIKKKKKQDKLKALFQHFDSRLALQLWNQKWEARLEPAEWSLSHIPPKGPHLKEPLFERTPHPTERDVAFLFWFGFFFFQVWSLFLFLFYFLRKGTMLP